MSVKRFLGETSREAMRRVRETLGDDALILANRQTEAGVEILAMSDGAVEALSATPEPLPAGRREPDASASPESPAGIAEMPHRPVGEAADLQAMSERLLREMQDMRALLADRPAPEATGGEALGRMLGEAGFGRALAEEVLRGLPAELDGEAALDWLRRRLVARLAVLEDEAAFFDPPGILALVGPTGVGKTTTTAKLAARFVRRHGAERVALVTTDGFRVGAHEQLRIYAELLGIPLHALAPAQSLDELLSRLGGRRWVIIDTVGMSQRDRRVITQAAQLQGGGSPVRTLLVLNATSQPGTLEEVASRYRQAARAAGASLDHCLLTKQDEADQLAPALDTVIRHGLRLMFVSTGQRVPEDLEPASADTLVDRALAARRPRPEGAAASPGRAGSPTSPWPGELLAQGRRLGLLLAALRERLSGFVSLEAAWDLSALPQALQEAGLSRLLSEPPEPLERVGMRWAPRRNLPGCDWTMPDLGLDARGGWWVLPDPQHRQPAGWLARLGQAREEWGVGVHLLPAVPDAETWRWLDEQRGVWSCEARPGQRLTHEGERHPLSALQALAEAAGERHCRFRGRSTRVRFARLAVEATPAGRRGVAAARPLLAWFADLQDPETGRALGRRFWLTPCRAPEDVLPLLIGHLHGEALPGQLRRAWQRLGEFLPAGTDSELRRLLAAGLAAAASHLDQAADAASDELRGDLMALLGGRRRRRDTGLLEAMLYLFVARDAIRHVGAAGLEGVR